MLVPSMHVSPVAGGNSVPALIKWGADLTALFDFQTQGSALDIKKIISVWIDNSANSEELTVSVEGSFFAFKVRSGVSGTFPIFALGLPKITVSSAGSGGSSTIVFLDYGIPFFSYAVEEVGQTVTDTTLPQVLTTVGDDDVPALRVTLGQGGIPDPLPVTFQGDVNVSDADLSGWIGAGAKVTDTTLAGIIGNGASVPTNDATILKLVGDDNYIPVRDQTLYNYMNSGTPLYVSDKNLSTLIGNGETLPTQDVNIKLAMSNSSLRTVSGFKSQGISTVAITGASFATSTTQQECSQVQVYNNSGTAIDLKLTATGDIVSILPGDSLTFMGDLFIQNFQIRRTDQAATDATVSLIYHST